MCTLFRPRETRPITASFLDSSRLVSRGVISFGCLDGNGMIAIRVASVFGLIRWESDLEGSSEMDVPNVLAGGNGVLCCLVCEEIRG